MNHLRCEKLTFNNPTIEFRYKLLMAGGVSVRSGWALPLLERTRFLCRGFISAPCGGGLGAGSALGFPGHISPAYG